MEFLKALSSHIFLQNAIFGGLLATIACGIAGTFVVIKRIGYIAGGIAHAIMGGVGIAYYLGVNPLIGGAVSSLFFSIILGFIRIKGSEHEDTVIGALWALGMATGIIFIHLTPGYNVDLMSFLFGNILMISSNDIKLLLVLNVVVFSIVFLFYRHFISICFDEEYAKLKKIPVTIIYIILLSVISLTIVALMQVVGLILVIALLTLPSAISAMFSKSPIVIMSLASILGSFFVVSGIYFSYTTNLPAGSAIIVFASMVYLFALSGKKLVKR